MIIIVKSMNKKISKSNKDLNETVKKIKKKKDINKCFRSMTFNLDSR